MVLKIIDSSTKNDIHRICNTRDVSEFIKTHQQRNRVAHLTKADNTSMTNSYFFKKINAPSVVETLTSTR